MSATEAEIRDAVIAALRRIAPDADPAALQPTENIRESLEIDSYDFLQFLIALNKQLQVDVPEADYGRLQSVADITAYIQARIESAAGQHFKAR